MEKLYGLRSTSDRRNNNEAHIDIKAPVSRRLFYFCTIVESHPPIPVAYQKEKDARHANENSEPDTFTYYMNIKTASLLIFFPVIISFFIRPSHKTRSIIDAKFF